MAEYQSELCFIIYVPVIASKYKPIYLFRSFTQFYILFRWKKEKVRFYIDDARIICMDLLESTMGINK